MMKFLMIRERIKLLLGRCNGMERNGMKFLLTLCTLFAINSQLGYNKMFVSRLLVVGVALICAFLPAWVISIVMSIFILAHFFCVSIELMVFTAIILLLMGLLYFSFHLGNSWIMVLTTVLGIFDASGAMLGFVMLLPYGITSVVPVCFGILLSALLRFVTKNVSILFSVNNTVNVFDQIGEFFNNQTLLILLVAVLIAMVLIYSLQKMSFNHVWYVSLISGGVIYILLLLLGVFVFEAEFNLTCMIVSTIIGILFSSGIHMLDIILDYSRVEYSQFEDDDYYYYVKAVPKISVAAPDKKVKTINKSRTEKLPDKESTKTLTREEISGSTVRIIREQTTSNMDKKNDE